MLVSWPSDGYSFLLSFLFLLFFFFICLVFKFNILLSSCVAPAENLTVTRFSNAVIEKIIDFNPILNLTTIPISSTVFQRRKRSKRIFARNEHPNYLTASEAFSPLRRSENHFSFLLRRDNEL